MRTQSGSTGHLLFKLVAMVVLLGLATNAHAASLSIQSWNFVGNAGDEASVNATMVTNGLQMTAITRSSGLTAIAAADTFNAYGWHQIWFLAVFSG